jgi:RecA-family ATPase
LVQNYLYADVATLIAPGGTGKTTQLLYETIHIVLGMPLYGLNVVSPGPVAILMAEDSGDVLYARLREIMSGLGLTDDQKRTVLTSTYVADLCGQDLRMVWRKDGTIKPTALADHIIERYSPINPALITIDPTVNFGAGEQQYSNDDAQALLTGARRIVRAVQCGVRYIHHTGKQNAKEWALDQYAGRGGSALPDGCRMVSVMQPWRPETEVQLPLGVTHGPGESVMVLARPKGSYHKPQPNIWITRRGWTFSHFVEGPPDKEAEKAALAAQVEQFLTAELQASRYHTQNSLQPQGLMKRDPLRRAISDLTASGRVVYAKMPKGRTGHGGAREYLHPLKFGAPPPFGAASEKEPEADDLVRREIPHLGGAPSYRDREFGAPRCADSLPPSPCCAGTPRHTNGAPSAPRDEAAMAEVRDWLQSLGEDTETITESLEKCAADPALMAGYLRSAREGR